MKAVRLTLWQIRYTNKAYWRNPAAAFFTFAFPLMFLVIFTSLLGHGHIDLGGRRIDLSTYYVAAMASFAVISASYVNTGIAVTFQRESGILKRIEGSPSSRPRLPHRPGDPFDVDGGVAGSYHRRFREGLYNAPSRRGGAWCSSS